MTIVSQPIRILHLEDRSIDAEQVARILKKAQVSCSIKLVSTRVQYTEALKNFNPEIIISDHNLPAFDSIEAMALLRQTNLKIPFILVTGTVSEEFAVEAMRSGADDYILKDRLQRLPIALNSILEKYRLDQEKRSTENLLRNIDANSLDMICSVSEDGYFLHVSAASEKILGYKPAELIGKRIFDFIYPEDREKTIDSANHVMGGNVLNNFENRYVRKDGSVITLSWSAQWDGIERIRYGVARDVTEQVLARKKIKAAEKAVVAERKQLSQLITNAPVSMCILKGVNHTFELVNPVFTALFGNRNYISRKAQDVFPEIEGQGFFEILDEVYKTGTAYAVDETVVKIDRASTGKLTDIYLNLLFEPYFDADGKVKGIFYFGVDITEQVLSRKKIEASEQRYRQIVETAQEGIWVIDEHDTTTFVNTKLCEILDYTREEMLGNPFSFFMDEEGKVLGKEFMEKKKSGQTCQGKIKYISKSGKEVWTHVSANPLLKEDGTYGGALSMVTDITQQKKIEEENKKLSDVASLTVNAVIVADAEGRITWVNKGFERMTEYTLEEVVGKRPGQFLKGANTDLAISKYMSECVKKGVGFQVEILNYSKSGRQYWLDIEARPLYDNLNKLTGFMAIEQDITQRKLFEATLVRRDNQLTLAAQIAGLGYWEYDVLGDQFTFNDQFYDIFKTTAETVGGYTLSSAQYAELFVHPEDRKIVEKSVAEAIQSVDSEFNFKTEHRILYATGEIGYISVHFRIVKDEAGITIKNFGVNQDITDRKKVELERLALIDGLQSKNKDLQQFSYIVSHNLRAPIAKIQGLVSIMESESEENKFLLEKLTEETIRLDDVVKDINTIVAARKSSKEKMECVLLETEFTLIQQVLEDKIAGSNGAIFVDFSAAPEIWTIKSYLYSILYNLVSNAIKYRKPEVPLQIEVQSFQHDKFICLTVKDNGEGIDLVKNGNKVFGLYKRFHTGNVPGKGIGLNLVKTHAESLGGRVEIESELAVGTTFRVYIPKYDGKL